MYNLRYEQGYWLFGRYQNNTRTFSTFAVCYFLEQFLYCMFTSSLQSFIYLLLVFSSLRLFAMQWGVLKIIGYKMFITRMRIFAIFSVSYFPFLKYLLVLFECFMYLLFIIFRIFTILATYSTCSPGDILRMR